MSNVSDDVTIISGDNGKIQSNIYILSLFCPTLRHLLSTSSTLLLPECSTFSIKCLLNMINKGFSVTDKLSKEDINEVRDTAKLLSIKMGKLYINYRDETVPNAVKTNKVAAHSEPKKQHINESEKKNEGKSESIMDVMDSLIRIFNPDYEPEEDVNIGENFGILHESEMAEPEVKKRKRNYVSRNNEGKYQCQQCDFEASRPGSLNKHVEIKHEGVRYPCNQCKFKGSTKQILWRHKESKHEGIRYPCNKCDYKANRECSLKKHKEYKHEGVRYPCNQCNFKGSTKRHLMMHKESKHEGIRYPCNQCDYKATQESDLKRHKEKKHERVRYPCDKCDYKGNIKSDLKRHEESKHQDICYSCDQCGFKTSRKGNLKTHVESIHEGVRYSCDQCEYKATQKGSLRAHIISKHH